MLHGSMQPHDSLGVFDDICRCRVSLRATERVDESLKVVELIEGET